MQDRLQHQTEVLAFLQTHFGGREWVFTLPQGSGHETYFVHGGEQAYFVKLGVHVARYEAMAALDLTPRVLAAGWLADGTSIIVQPFIPGREPCWKDFRIYLEPVAAAIHRTHHSRAVQQALPEACSTHYREMGLAALASLQQRWETYRPFVPGSAGFVDESLAYLAQQIQGFEGTGLVASHNDICNANWLVTADGQIYLIDLESMSLDDPALDVGAILWWYYPPGLRQRFLEIVGHAGDAAFQQRMQVRMALHCLNIILPRRESFDRFDPTEFDEALVDFRAVLNGEENPQGYED